jgi:hypothetical protein
MAEKMRNTKMAPTYGEKGILTSPARYAVAVAAEVTIVAMKSKSNNTAATKARNFVETFRLYDKTSK